MVVPSVRQGVECGGGRLLAGRLVARAPLGKRQRLAAGRPSRATRENRGSVGYFLMFQTTSQAAQSSPSRWRS